MRNPIVRTYVKMTTSPSGETKFHVRLYSREYDLDKRGTGASIEEAILQAKSGVSASQPRSRQR